MYPRVTGAGTYRELPKNEIAGILERQVARSAKAFSDIPTFTNPPTSFVFLLLRRPNLVEAKLNI